MIGIIGGSGFYSFFNDTYLRHGMSAPLPRIDTPFGKASSEPVKGVVGGKEVIFLARHGRQHSYQPHEVPYQANMLTLKEYGVDRIIGVSAVGSLLLPFKPGHFVIPDQIFDRTNGRPCTVFEHPNSSGAHHTSVAEPYDLQMGRSIKNTLEKMGATCHMGGTVVVIQGPRFSTKAESKFFIRMGWELVNMTQAPEVFMANELGMKYCGVMVVTDYDFGIDGGEPVTHEQVLKNFNKSIDTLRDALVLVIENSTYV